MEKPPVIVIVGHIDHGKSTLLDYIRKTKVVEGEAGSPRVEAGGITQQVSAYEITHQGKNITFIDTPGHEAFSAMRGQGVAAADLAVLIVSAEEGVKPQTLEARATIEEYQLPYLVAINKIDRPAANVELTKKSLAENGIYLEGMGGEVPCVAISAKTGAGVPELLDLILLAAEMAMIKNEKQKLDPNLSDGFILEAQINPKRGITATAIIKNGTLHSGDYLTTLDHDCFRIKKLENFRGEEVPALSASSPTIVLGWKTVPPAGARWYAATAKTAIEKLIKNTPNRVKKITQSGAGGIAMVENENEKVIPIVIKAQTLGMLQAVEKEIKKIAVAGVKIQVLDARLGDINENDIKLISATTRLNKIKIQPIVVGFQVKIEKVAADLMLKYQTVGRTFDVIYKLGEWLIEELTRQRPRIEVEVMVGAAKVVKLFSVTKNKQIIGGLVLEGKIVNRKKVHIKRRGAVIGEGEILELQQQQMVVKEMEKGKQFGALVETRYTLAVGDVLEILEIEIK